jgi:small conductance mechanosensitive channel
MSMESIWTDFGNLPNWVHTLVQVALVFIVGWIVDWILDRTLDRALKRNKFVDDTARKFLVRTLDIVVWAVTFVVALSYLGVDPAALAGGIAVSGFIVGFALKDTLGNLAAGLMLLVYRPFHVDDVVTIGGDSGGVVSLGVAMTVLKTADGKLITIPNGNVLGGTITNHTRENIRRADVTVGIHYNDDIGQATQAILAAVNADARVLSDPEVSVRITSLGDSAVGLQVRPWVATGDYWQAQADLHATVKQALLDAGCSIPYPQQDIHLHQK